MLAIAFKSMNTRLQVFIAIIAYIVLFPMLSTSHVSGGIFAAVAHLIIYIPGILHYRLMEKEGKAGNEIVRLKHSVIYVAYSVVVIPIISLMVYSVFINPGSSTDPLVYVFIPIYSIIYWMILLFFGLLITADA